LFAYITDYRIINYQLLIVNVIYHLIYLLLYFAFVTIMDKNTHCQHAKNVPIFDVSAFDFLVFAVWVIVWKRWLL